MRHCCTKPGVGTGLPLFSQLRPQGDTVASTGGAASGPVWFLSVFEAAADVLSQWGGRRLGASMAVLEVSHPDIVDFVDVKWDTPETLEHFNLSVGVSHQFMRATTRAASTPW